MYVDSSLFRWLFPRDIDPLLNGLAWMGMCNQ